ncbi:phosphotransferase enzyme family protein [Streptomyces davaonensis JCM 4913]|uniref:Phosphotransferase enzyme family protein n=1 Tax=Streptomyces davaonensis (strain DSM 101723 / JCM 4913 / KCC S-0913 / 768) TaxID=1214101 RepID=K4R5Z9_STRDJ|nr:phosphotransferase [Streptomyces davaonensis]CCK28773.1 phosphotransferase enzyme family protein [Streptomyces davaonensis JCM 4913]
MHPAPPLGALLPQYAAGCAVACEPVDQGLLNRGYRLRTTRGRYFLKHHFDPETADPTAIARQHRATERLAGLGVPVAPPLPARDGRTVAVIGGHAYALHPWIDGRHRHGGQLTPGQCTRLGALLGAVHAGLERVMPPERRAPVVGADPADTFALITDLLARVRRHRPADSFDTLARHRLLERRALLERHADRRPPRGGPVGWVHGDFHPFNLLYKGDAPAAIVDWDRLGVQPRAEEAVRAAAIFFVRPAGTLDLPKVRAYTRAYRRTAGATASELAAAVHRVWWERLNDFWMLRWHYERGDTRADPQFPAASALVVWWTREYDAVCDAFVD